ncbi:MAG: hypothetical protein K0Q52_183 [Microbacterium sp.]|jgi:hypothetical protein|nr:hypothetical protein [Microbacterium sp.]
MIRAARRLYRRHAFTLAALAAGVLLAAVMAAPIVGYQFPY